MILKAITAPGNVALNRFYFLITLIFITKRATVRFDQIWLTVAW